MPGLMDEPEWPKEYCKVGQVRATFKNACQLTSESGWKDEDEVVETWPWVHYKNEPSGFRESANGDVFVEDNGNAWFWEGSVFKYLGKAYNKAAAPDPADDAAQAAAAEAGDWDGTTVNTAPSLDVFEDGESALMASERAAEEARIAEIEAARAAAQEEAQAAAEAEA